MSNTEPIYYRWIAGAATLFLALYCAAVLFFVATSGDLGIRCLVNSERESAKGIEIRQFLPASEGVRNGLPAYFGNAPSAGDRILEINGYPIHTFASFSRATASLSRSLSEESEYGSRLEEVNPLDHDHYGELPSVIVFASKRPAQNPAYSDSAGELTGMKSRFHQAKYVRIKYLDSDTGTVEKSFLMLRALPTLEVVLSIIWCLLEFSIFTLAALSFYTRPSDHAGRMFFLLCFLTLPAFVGGYHWWVIASSPLLTFPFVISAILIPVTTLHFFLNYPSRNRYLEKYTTSILTALYAAPALMLVTTTFLLAVAYLAYDSPSPTPGTQTMITWLRFAIDTYILIAAVYYGLSMGMMFINYRACQQPAEQKQMQWILGAACLALPLVIYTVYLAYADRVGMSLGRGRIPMVIVSLLFLTAYAIGILRYRLMLIDQILSRRVLYLILSQLLTVSYSLLIAMGSVLTVYRGISVPEQVFPLTIILTLGILALGWLRDRVQEALDRRFFREKYRLDRAMQQMNTVVTKVADVRSLAEHMLRSSREVLQVRFNALYLREGKTHEFNLISAVNGPQLPSRISLDEETDLILEKEGSCQRVGGSSRSEMPKLQQLHRELNSQLIHGFEVDGRLTGLVVLGPKASSSPYTAEDTTFVSAIGQMTGVALQCVRVQQNVSRLDNMLQEKVRKVESQERQIAILKQQLASNVQEEPVESTPKLEDKTFQRGKIRGSSPEMIRVLDSARKVAESDTSVMIRGESGTGKELLAQAIHANSSRKVQEMVSVNCAALSPSLLESELFGHVKGAFTGAYKDTVGRFQLADKGTLFLDEIGDLPADVQVKLLRVLQERKFEPVGSRESISVDVRLIAATHQNLEERIKNGLFRQDLYYRLNVITLILPPLRERKEDLFLLSLEFLKEAADKANKPMRDIDDLAFRALLNYDWPGNIRELHNAIQRAVVLAETDCLLLENLPLEVRDAVSDKPLSIYEAASRSSPKLITPSTVKQTVVSSTSKRKLSRQQEYEQLANALKTSDGNKAEAARLLGMPRSTFYSKLKKHKLSN